jgi:hypothetical protein
VVEDDVENHLDARAVQRLHHVAKFVKRSERVGSRAVGLMRREERDRLVSPVVAPAAWRIVAVELEHGEELHGGDAQVAQVRDLLDDAGVGAASGVRHPGARMLREATHVHLVDHRTGERLPERPIALPVVRGGSGDDTFQGRGAVVAGSNRRAAVVRIRHGDRQSIRVDEHLLRVEPQTAFRRERPVRAVPIDLTGLQVGHERMPVVIRPVPALVERHDA